MYRRGCSSLEIIWSKLTTQEKNELVFEKVMKETLGGSADSFNPMENMNDAWGIVMKFGLWHSFKQNYNRSMEVSMGNDLSDGEVVTFCLLVSDELVENFIQQKQLHYKKPFV
jgi:hypothetical protein